MQQEKNKVDEVVEHLENYLDTQQQITKLTIAEKTSIIGASLLSGFIIGALFLLVFLFASIALAFYLSTFFEKAYTGFLLVTGIYFFIGIILLLFRKSLLLTPFTNSFIKNILKENNHE